MRALRARRSHRLGTRALWMVEMHELPLDTGYSGATAGLLEIVGFDAADPTRILDLLDALHGGRLVVRRRRGQRELVSSWSRELLAPDAPTIDTRDVGAIALASRDFPTWLRGAVGDAAASAHGEAVRLSVRTVTLVRELLLERLRVAELRAAARRGAA